MVAGHGENFILANLACITVYGSEMVHLDGLKHAGENSLGQSTDRTRSCCERCGPPIMHPVVMGARLEFRPAIDSLTSVAGVAGWLRQPCSTEYDVEAWPRCDIPEIQTPLARQRSRRTEAREHLRSRTTRARGLRIPEQHVSLAPSRVGFFWSARWFFKRGMNSCSRAVGLPSV